MRLTQLINYELQRRVRHPQLTIADTPYSLHPEVFRVSLQEDPSSEEGEIGETTETDEAFGPPSVFPIAMTYPVSVLPAKRLEPRYTDRWPMAFDMKDMWLNLWDGPTIQLDSYLQEFRLPYRGTYVTEIPETEYRGTPWRLHISEKKAHGKLSILRHGTIVSYRNSNTKHLQYIIDHCVFRDKTVAHLKVYCFNIGQDICEVNSTRPPFLLVVPLDYCHVRNYSSEPDPCNKFPSMSVSRPHAFHPSQTSHFSDDEEDLGGRGNFIVRIYRRLCQAKH